MEMSRASSKRRQLHELDTHAFPFEAFGGNERGGGKWVRSFGPAVGMLRFTLVLSRPFIFKVSFRLERRMKEKKKKTKQAIVFGLSPRLCTCVSFVPSPCLSSLRTWRNDRLGASRPAKKPVECLSAVDFHFFHFMSKRCPSC